MSGPGRARRRPAQLAGDPSARRTAASSVAARSVRARPAAAEQALELRPALADQHRRRDALGDDRAEPARSTPLSRPPAISTIGGSKARSAAITASGWVPCESLTKRTPSIDGDRSRADARRRGRRPAAADRVGRDPEEQRHRDRRERVRDVVRARDAQLGDRQDPAIGGRARPARRRRRAARRSTPSATIQPSTDAERRRASVGPAGRPPPRVRRGPRSRPTTGSSSVEDERAGRVDQLGEPALDRAGTPRACRGGRGGRPSRSCRRRRVVPRDSVGSCSSDSSITTRCVGREVRQPLDERVPDVAAEDARMAPGPRPAAHGVSADVVVLPFVPVMPIVGAGQRRRNRSTSDTIAGALGRRPARRATSVGQRGPESRLGRRDSRG